jgi:hypothetical protein
MKDRDLAPLDAEVLALLRRGTHFEPAQGVVKERVFARVEAAVTPLGAGGSGPGGAHDPPPPRVHGSRTSLARRAFPWLAGFAIGAPAGALAVRMTTHAQRPPEPPRIVYLERSAATAETPAPLADPASPVAAELPRMAPSVPALTAPAPSARTDLTGERALLDVARGALEREDGVATLATIEEHQRKYPNGVLVQEREAMAIRALVMLGRTGDARTRVERFRRRFPDSLLLPTLESTIDPPAR